MYSSKHWENISLSLTGLWIIIVVNILFSFSTMLAPVFHNWLYTVKLDKANLFVLFGAYIGHFNYLIFNFFKLPIESWMTVTVAGPILEELEFRAPLLFLKNKYIKIGYAVISSVLFAFAHWHPLGLLIPILVLALFSSWLVIKTNNILPSIILHIVYNSWVTFWLLSK